MRKISIQDRLRYQFDTIMARGTIALIGWLFILSAALIILVSILVMLTNAAPPNEDGRPLHFGEIVWMNLMRSMDAGTLGGDSGSWYFLLLMLITTIGGIFVFSTLIGVLSSGIEQKLAELRKGRSFVVEKGHTIIFGWSPLIFAILSELVQANASEKDACIVILAHKDKVEMEDEIRARVGNTGCTRVVCRTGSPMDLTALEIVNPNSARSMIILLPPDDESPDSTVIQTILAITQRPDRRPTPYHIVAELADPANLDIARAVGKNEVKFVLVNDLVSRLAVQTSLQSGLSVVYNELLSFAGCEIYFHDEAALTGQPVATVLQSYDTAAVIGLRRKDGAIMLKPPRDTVLEAGDTLIVIAEDDSTIRPTQPNLAAIEQDAIQPVQPPPARLPERTLVLGWNQNARSIISLLDPYLAPGSEITLSVEADTDEVLDLKHPGSLRNQRVNLEQGNMTNRRTLEELQVTTYNNIIVLGTPTPGGTQAADARTLVTLLHLREMREQSGTRFSIVAEMRDSRNRRLAEVTQADDFIVSDRLVSLMLSQISQQGDISVVLSELFSPEGSEIYLKPMGNYIALDRPLTFATVVEAASQRDEIAIGYRCHTEANNAKRAYGIHLNPKKSERITFHAEDKIIVLSEQ